MAEYLKRQGFASPLLIPSGGGAFEIKVDDQLIFSKLHEHRFPDHAEVIELIRQLRGKAGS
ncbi:SelT/SelW/SelH family protein [candidate division KSB1 bacterium]|nr:SelT/SelW/SelH family protein [candidate division KSB1 bacterium]